MLATQALAADAAAVRTMLEKSGFVAQYADLGEQMRQGMIESPPPMLPPGVVTLMATIVGNTMDGGKLLDEVQTVLAASLSDKDVRRSTPSSSPSSARASSRRRSPAPPCPVQQKISAKAETLAAEARKDPERVAVFDRIDKMLHSAELSARSSESLLRAMAVAMAESGPMPPDPGKLAEANARIDGDARRLGGAGAHHDRWPAAQRVYRDFSTAEMKRYAEFLETDPSQVMYAAFSGVMDTFYAETGKRIGEEIGGGAPAAEDLRLHRGGGGQPISCGRRRG